MTARHRENLVARTGERWRPPSFSSAPAPFARISSAVRRFFDLQAGSLWLDLKPSLSNVSGTVLDVGCGAQPYRPLLSRSTRYIGLDSTRADADFGYSFPRIRIIDSSGRWPVEDSEADVVLATEVLEHVVDPSGFLLEAFRSLRPGGKIIMTVPFAARWHYIPQDYWRFTPSGLRVMLERAGFREVVVYGRGNESTVACYKLLALLLPLALPQRDPGSVRFSPLALLAVPLIVMLAVIGNITLRQRAGDDCLGYTIYAVRPLVAA